MISIRQTAATVLAASLLLGAGTTAASAFETVPGTTEPVLSDVAPVVITEADVAVSHAAFKQAQVDAQAVEQLFKAESDAAEKAAQDAAKLVKGKATKDAQAQVQALRAANQAGLKALKAENDVVVNAAKAAYQEVAAAYEAQQSVVEEAPVVEQAPVLEEVPVA